MFAGKVSKEIHVNVSLKYTYKQKCALYPTVAIGVCVLIHPLSVGQSAIHIAASNPTFGIACDVTFGLEVDPGQ
jgi:hypothetical protein